MEFFEVPPSKEDPENGLWCYEADAPNGVRLLFCFNIFERWLKTQVVVQDAVVDEVLHEGAARLWIERRPRGTVLVGECDLGKGRSRLEIVLRPEISVSWSTLIEPFAP